VKIRSYSKEIISFSHRKRRLREKGWKVFFKQIALKIGNSYLN
jgi:hypothetical protein